jgi:Holliday junction resolvase RusA-like endonuclease
MIIIIPGKPIAKARPKFYTKKMKSGKSFTGTYTTQQDEQGWFIDGHIPFSGPVEITIWFGMPRPKSHYGTGRNKGVLKGSAPGYPVVKPDEDNLKKFVYDLFNGRVWGDDRQVCRSICEKAYADRPRTEILVRELEY